LLLDLDVEIAEMERALPDDALNCEFDLRRGRGFYGDRRARASPERDSIRGTAAWTNQDGWFSFEGARSVGASDRPITAQELQARETKFQNLRR
jgi:hypothetical protein